MHIFRIVVVTGSVLEVVEVLKAEMILETTPNLIQCNSFHYSKPHSFSKNIFDSQILQLHIIMLSSIKPLLV
jgi:hypothetical protein